MKFESSIPTMKMRKPKIKATMTQLQAQQYMIVSKRIPDGTVVVNPNIQVDHRTPIWDVLYDMEIPYIATLTDKEVDVYGIPTTGIARIDDDVLLRLQPVSINIDKAVDVFAKGFKVVVPKVEDVVLIYDAVQEYIQFWASRRTGATVHVTTAPMEDLETMDRFADKIYSYIAQYSKSPVDVHSRDLATLLTCALPMIKDLEKSVVIEDDGHSAPMSPRSNLLDLFTDGIPTANTKDSMNWSK